MTARAEITYLAAEGEQTIMAALTVVDACGSFVQVACSRQTGPARVAQPDHKWHRWSPIHHSADERTNRADWPAGSLADKQP